MELRDYQQDAINLTTEAMRAGETPCIVIPTGGGKSLIIAAFCKMVLQSWPGTRILIVTMSRELVAQNAEEMSGFWPNAPVAVYSAGLNRREVDALTFANIHSVYDKSTLLGHIDLVVIDEAQNINHEEQGMYRELIASLRATNPHLGILGLTATPYRMGHGKITDGDALFTTLIEPVSIEELIARGYLCPLRSKDIGISYDLSNVHKRGGEYIESELAAAVDTAEQNEAIVKTVIASGQDRKSWLFFCTGVDHAIHVRDCLREHGILAETVNGQTPKGERDDILRRYKAGEVRAVTNCGVLTTGFNHKGVDLIAMMRPTMSVVLYVQIAGRGTRTCDGKTDCLFLDFAGVVSEHGPITSPRTPEQRGAGGGQAPTKKCPQCSELVHLSARVCTDCGYQWPAPEEKDLTLRNDDIMGNEPSEMRNVSWYWSVHTKRDTGEEMLKVEYRATVHDPVIREYFTIMRGEFGSKRAWYELGKMAREGRWILPKHEDIHVMAERMNHIRPPTTVSYRRDGEWFRIVSRHWEQQQPEWMDDDDIPF